jgi:hypothetical protein
MRRLRVVITLLLEVEKVNHRGGEEEKNALIIFVVGAIERLLSLPEECSVGGDDDDDDEYDSIGSRVVVAIPASTLALLL